MLHLVNLQFLLFKVDLQLRDNELNDSKYLDIAISHSSSSKSLESLKFAGIVYCLHNLTMNYSHKTLYGTEGGAL